MEQCDLLIIGIGAAGAAAALRAADLGMAVTVLTASPEPAKGSNTSWAQGGIIFRGRGDSAQSLEQDIHAAGHHICHEPAVSLVAERGPEIVRELLIERCGVPFDREGGGGLHLTEEAAHAMPRIIHVEDATGRAIAQALAREVATHPGIRLVTGAVAVELIMRGLHTGDPRDLYKLPACLGAYVLFPETGEVQSFTARETLLATGGLGQIFLHTTNPRKSRGDGLAMAYRAGARVINLEYIQFHPTALYHRLAPRFLLSESMRGEGARLLNADGEPFMKRYHELGDLAPRDVVARSIHMEMEERGEECMYLDISHKPADWSQHRFPLIHNFLQKWGLDMAKQPIPIVPAAHYSCGGVAVDLHGCTNIAGLRAAGEVSCTGLHGANRLASTSLLEAITWGYQVAEGVMADRHAHLQPDGGAVIPWQSEEEEADPALIQQDWQLIKLTMWNYVGLVRRTRRLRRALKILRELQYDIENFYRMVGISDEIVGLRNGVQTALAVTHAAFRNRQSRGGHYRLD